MPNQIHIIPIGDKIEHRADYDCCGAYLDPDGMWIHHSADKREQFERQGSNGKQWGTFWADENEKLGPLEC